MVLKLNEQIISTISDKQITKFGKQQDPFILRI